MEYKLIYVNKVGFSVGGSATYEFVFCDDSVDLEDVWGDGWEAVPAEGQAQPPDEESIAKIGVLKLKEYELEVAHESMTFGLCDVKDDVVALAWEAIDENFSAKNVRLVFKFGDLLTDIEAKLKKRNLELKYED